MQQRLLSDAPQQQEENVHEHKHVFLLSAQLDRGGGGGLQWKDGKWGGKDFTHSEQPWGIGDPRPSK